MVSACLLGAATVTPFSMAFRTHGRGSRAGGLRCWSRKRGDLTAGTCSRGPGSVLTSPAAQLGGLPNISDIQEGYSRRWCLVLQLELLKGA